MAKTIYRCLVGLITFASFAACGHAAVTLGNFDLTSDQEVPASTSTVVGSGQYSFNDESNRLMLMLQFTGRLDLDGEQTPDTANDDLTGLHVHYGAMGLNGGVVFNLLSAPETLVDGGNSRVLSIWEVDDEHVANLIAGDLYVNAHTTEFPGGAVRGQIILPQGDTIPEPSVVGLLLLGAGILTFRRRIG